MATIQQILNKIKDMAARTGLFAIGKNEFFDTLTDMTNKMSEINDNVNSVAKSLVWQEPVVDIVNMLPSSGLTAGQRYVLTTNNKIYTATSTTQFDAGTTPEAGWAVKNQNDGYIHSYNGAVWKNTGLTAFPEEVVVESELLTKNINSWTLTESFSISSPAFDANGYISGAVITWPDGNIGSISNVVTGAHGITSIRYNRSEAGKYATVNIAYDGSGVVSNQTVVLTGF